MHYIEYHIIAESEFTTANKFLKRASISRNGSEVTVDFAVTDGYPEASCVLVYREYGNPMLRVAEFPQPITLNIDRPEDYTFAIFGKNGATEIEEEPAFIVKFITVPQPSLSPSPGECVVQWPSLLFLYSPYLFIVSKASLLAQVFGQGMVTFPLFISLQT